MDGLDKLDIYRDVARLDICIYVNILYTSKYVCRHTIYIPHTYSQTLVYTSFIHKIVTILAFKCQIVLICLLVCFLKQGPVILRLQVCATMLGF